ncbi:hypothetical protein DSO57_1034770 [Entomophthora muscae]|uniref:Uncharacterized protein n=1 Tax=Entomophthora muscae TaxID=34485 RepID=A0ACC2SNN4_9FUNG|nr:hypothetical protein DSO57_1034770 [Entomophthora muscae]
MHPISHLTSILTLAGLASGKILPRSGATNEPSRPHLTSVENTYRICRALGPLKKNSGEIYTNVLTQNGLKPATCDALKDY